MHRKLCAPALALIVTPGLLALALYALRAIGLFDPLLRRPTFHVVTIVLAVLAIIFASIQFVDSLYQRRKMEAIAESMSTRYIGLFPKNLEDIHDVAKLSDRDLMIMADFVDYGQYSNPEAYTKFFQEVSAACDRGVTVRFLVYAEPAATEAFRQQFPPDEFDEIKSSRTFRHYFEKYRGVDKPASYEEFFRILRKRERDIAEHLLDKGVKIRVLPKEERLFFWLADDEDAVFSFENVGAKDPLCFRTQDAKLIEIFRGIFDAIWNNPADPFARTLMLVFDEARPDKEHAYTH